MHVSELSRIRQGYPSLFTTHCPAARECFETMPSRPRRQAWAKIIAPLPAKCSLNRIPSGTLATRATPSGASASLDHAPRVAFLHVWATVARRRSVRLDRCEATRRATRLGLICLCRRLVGAHGPAAHGPDGIRPRQLGTTPAPDNSSAAGRGCARCARSRARRS